MLKNFLSQRAITLDLCTETKHNHLIISTLHPPSLSMDKLEALEGVVKVGGAIGGGWGAIKVIKRMFVSLKIKREESAKRIAAMQTVIDDHARVLLTLDDIRKEIKPNGGSSLRDSIDRIENSINMSALMNDAQMTALGVAYWRADGRGRWEHVSQDLCRIVGVTETEMLGSNWLSLIHEDDREEVTLEWKAAVRGMRKATFECNLVRPSGRMIRVKAVASPLINAKTEIMHGLWGNIVEIPLHREI